MKDSSHYSADAHGRTALARGSLKLLSLLLKRLLPVALVALLLINYGGGYLQLWYRDGYIVECRQGSFLDDTQWKITLKETDGDTYRFSADGKYYRYFCYRRGYYGYGSPHRHERNTSIHYSTNPHWLGGGGWYPQSRSGPVGKVLAGCMTHADREAWHVRLYYRPISKWIVDSKSLRK